MRLCRGSLWWVKLAGVLLLGIIVFQPFPASVNAQSNPPLDPRFGVIEPHHAPEQAAELGAAWGRARFHWALIQPGGPDQWQVDELTAGELAGEIGAGREVVGLLIGIPDWAKDDAGLPKGLYLAPDNPGNLWANFVREAVTRYAGQIDHWIIWNEPDVWNASHPAYTWPGDVDDYVRLLKVAYLVANDANPDSVIHLAAMSHWWDVEYNRELYFPRLLDAILADPDAAQNDYFYDAATLQLYFNPATVYEIVEEYRGYQSERGLDKPVWLVETNAAPTTDPAWPVADPNLNVTLLEQAAYMPQGLALALAAGADRVAIYKLIDTPGDVVANPEPFGLVRADHTPRPAFKTAQVAIDLLSAADRLTWNERHIVSQVVVEKSDQIVRLLWSRVPVAQSVEIPALAGSAELVDMWGNRQEIEAENDRYHLTLYAGECLQTAGDYCMIGGPPVYVIETIDSAKLPLEEGSLPPISSYEPLDEIEVSPRRVIPVTVYLVIGALVIGAGMVLTIKRKRGR